VIPARVIHINTERGWRGGEVQTLVLARGLARRGHPCLLVAPPASPLQGKAEMAGLPVAPLRSRGEFDLFAVARLARLFRSFRPDLVHYHTSHAITLGTLASLRSGRVAAIATRRVSFPLSRNPLARWKYTRRVDRVIAVSHGILELLAAAGVPRERINVIPSAVDLDRFRELPAREESRESLGYAQSDFVVGAIGHLAEHKGHAVLLEAVRHLAPQHPALRFLLVGQGELKDDLLRRIRTLGLEARVRLLGFADEVAEILPALDVLAFPSLSGEGSPAVLKEAMACGVPVVASRISGVEEVVRDGAEGILVPPGNAAALAEALVRIASDRSLGIEFGRRGRERAREFGADKMLDATVAVYRALLEENRP